MVSPIKKDNKKLQKLIKEAIAGDETAFGKLYHEFFDRIYRFIYIRVSHKETAEDLVSEVFIKVWDNIGNIEKEGAFAGWMFQIARNLVIDHYRAKKQHVDLYTLENILQYEDVALDKANFSFDQKRFWEQVQKLSDDQQTVLKLKFIDELENEEIAVLLGKKEGAIRVIQHRALKEVKKLLENDE